MRRGVAGTIIAGTSLFALILLFSLITNRTPSAEAETSLPLYTTSARLQEPIQPIEMDYTLDQEKVRLGRELFHDARLSADNTVSCASCHDLRTGGVDGLPVSKGIQQRKGKRNSPTVYNCGLNYRQFWDGRAATLEEQVDGPLQSAVEMGATWESVIEKLHDDTRYIAAFARIYHTGITRDAIRNAIATFERSLITPAAAFDRFIKGDRTAISEAAKQGYHLFKGLGCISCHQGRNIGANMMQPFGVMQSPHLTETRIQASLHWLKEGKSIALYKVPSLRNIAVTAPYFHTGAVRTLSEAVRIMSEAQLCRTLSDTEIQQIVSFLKTLTGNYEGKQL